MLFDLQLTSAGDLRLHADVLGLLDEGGQRLLFFVVHVRLVVVFLDLAEAILEELLLRLLSASRVCRALNRLAALVGRPTCY